MSKETCDYIAYPFLRSLIGLKISRRNLNQSEVKPVVTWSLTFWRHFWFFSVNFEFLLTYVIFPFAIIGQSEAKPVTCRDLVTYILAPF